MRLLPFPVQRLSRAIARLAALALLGCGAGEDLGGPDLGAVEVVTETTGSGEDPDGYAVAVDGGVRTPIGQADTVFQGGLQPARHAVALDGLSPSCTLEGENPRDVSVNPAAVARVTFRVDCAAPPLLGSLEVETVTSGSDLDPDGYQLAIDPDVHRPTGLNEVAVFGDMAEGDHAVRLEGVASNCSTRGTNPRIVAVAPGSATRTTFEVSCWPQATGQLAYTFGNFGFIDGSEIYVRNADGTGARNLTDTPFDSEKDPAWSPDGTRLVFVRNENQGALNQMYMVSAAGGSPTKFLAGVDAEEPRWSPDGSRLLFRSLLSIWTVNANGTGKRQVTNDTLLVFTSASWSPDGRRIAFEAARQDENFSFISDDLYLINATGGAPISLSAGLDVGGVRSVAWSPDGSRIACITTVSDDPVPKLVTISPDGRTLTVLRDSAGTYGLISWSPDGTKLAVGIEDVAVLPPPEFGFPETDVIYIMNADGTGARPFTGLNETASAPAWGP